VAQHLSDLRQRRAGAQHLGRQRVPEPVRTAARQPGPVASPTHDLANRFRRQLPVRPPHRHEHRPRRATGTALGHPLGKRLPGRDRQWEPLDTAALTADRNLAGPPVNVVQLQAGGLGAAQPEPGQQRQDRVIAAADGRVPITTGQQPLDLGRRHPTRQRGQPP
jgi:hypothetical protein